MRMSLRRCRRRSPMVNGLDPHFLITFLAFLCRYYAREGVAPSGTWAALDVSRSVDTVGMGG